MEGDCRKRQQAKNRGVKLGGAREHLKAHNAEQARLMELEAAAIAPFVLPLRQQGATVRPLTRTLNDIGLKTKKGSKWQLSGAAEACYWLKERGKTEAGMKGQNFMH